MGKERSDLRSWDPIQNEFALFFQVLQKDEQKILICFGPAGRTDTAGIYLVRGNEAGDIEPLPRLKNVIVASTTQLPFFTALHKERTISGVVHLAEVFDPRIRELAATGAIKEVGTADGLDQEAIISLAPQAIFDHPFGRNMHAGIGSKPTVHITEYLEPHPLGRAEWLKVFGILLEEEQQADEVFTAIRDRYLSVAREYGDHKERPLVFFASSWQGQWFAPPANSYMATLIEDAGGRYSFSDRKGEGNISMDLETVLHEVRKADRFGMILSTSDTITATVLAAGESRLASLKAVTEGGFFGNSAATDLFGQAVLEPDRMLADLVNIFHAPENSSPEFQYFQPLVRNATVVERDPSLARDTVAPGPAHGASHGLR